MQCFQWGSLAGWLAVGLGDSFYSPSPESLVRCACPSQGSPCYCWKKVGLPSVPAGSACGHPSAPSSLFLAICYCGSHWSELSKLFFTLSTVLIRMPLLDDVSLLWFPPLSGPGHIVLLQTSFRNGVWSVGWCGASVHLAPGADLAFSDGTQVPFLEKKVLRRVSDGCPGALSTSP